MNLSDSTIKTISFFKDIIIIAGGLVALYQYILSNRSRRLNNLIAVWKSFFDNKIFIEIFEAMDRNKKICVSRSDLYGFSVLARGHAFNLSEHSGKKVVILKPDKRGNFPACIIC